ncbi:hypothetical protein PITCH_A680010 [uncultured Desulfobacterium sp.]|uniref:Uncharacterized protein n=1 Tax=uncultured Desulfobacterium sp. TaxID=201089 RepID=A0A445N1N9_9BACT|nr:hypothetical protein PITCH_A680010 [uncultured Desulfobacterium sp.]
MQKATSMAVISSPCNHTLSPPPRIVVLACLPTADKPIRGVTLAITRTIAAANVRARVRPRESGLFWAMMWPQRRQQAFPPGGISGMRCNRSQSGQAMISSVIVDTLVSLKLRELTIANLNEYFQKNIG